MPPVNIFFKNHYTKQELKECFDWFEQRMDRLPKSLEIPSARILDLPCTVRRMISVLRHQFNNLGVFNGQFAILLQIRQVLQQNHPDL